jgi:hypothetical protein
MPFITADHVRQALVYLPDSTHPPPVTFLAMLRNTVSVSATPDTSFGSVQEIELMMDFFAPEGGRPERPFYVPFGFHGRPIMGLSPREQEWADKARLFLKSRLKLRGLATRNS